MKEEVVLDKDTETSPTVLAILEPRVTPDRGPRDLQNAYLCALDHLRICQTLISAF